MRLKGIVFCLLLMLAACSQSVTNEPSTPVETIEIADESAVAAPVAATDTAEVSPTNAPEAEATAVPPTAPAAFDNTFSTPVDIANALTLHSETAVINREPGNKYLNGGAVIFHEGQFHLFSNFFNSWPGTTATYYYTSPDGKTWTRSSDEPLFTIDDVPLDGRGALVLSGLVQPDGTWVLYYHTFTSNGQPGVIGQAIADSPTGPWTFAEEPVLTPGSAGAWDDLQVMRVNVLSHEDGYVMYYAGVNKQNESRIGMAFSPDGSTWQKYDDPTTTEAPYAESDPIMEPESEWEETWLGRPEVVYTDDGWVMLYEGGTRGSQTGLAISEDGIHFARYEDNPILTQENMVAGFTFFQGAFFHENDTYYYLIEAGDGRIGTDIFLYTLEGSLLKDTAAANPNVPIERPPFVFASHYGGQPAGQWDETNWEAFLENHPDLNATLQPTDYYNAYVNRTIHNQLQSERPPDVFSAALGGSLYRYAEEGIIADISDLWQEQGWDEIFPASVKEMASVNGRQYFVPQAIQWNGIFYRTDVMEAAGVAPPTTWADFLAACDALNAADITPLAMTASSTWPPPMGFWFTHINQRLNGPQFHEQLMRGEVSYNDPRVRAVFDYYQQLFEHNCFDERATSSSYNQAISKFESGEAAMYAHGEWLYEFIDEETKAVTDFMRFPIIDEAIPLGELVPMFGAFMWANTPYPQEARDFLIFVGDEASQASNLATLKRLPSNLNVDRSALLPVYEKGLQTVEEATVLTQLIGANTDPAVATELLTVIGRFWRNPEGIDDMLAEVEAVRQEIYGDSGVATAVDLNFTQASTEPVISRNSEPSNRLDPGAMIYHDDQFHMFINRFDSFPGAVEIGYATSADGLTWNEHDGEPLLTTESVPFADVAVVASDVIIEPDGTWVLYFHTWQTSSLANGEGVIGRATAPNPLGPWTVDSASLIFIY